MSFVNTYQLEFGKEVGNFNIFVKSTVFDNKVDICLTYHIQGDDKFGLHSRYETDIIDLQTTSPKNVAEAAVKHNLKKLSKQLNSRNRALDSIATYNSLKMTAVELINQFLKEHEKQVEKDIRKERRKEKIYGKV